MLLLLLLLGPTGSGLGAHVFQQPSRAICKSGTSVKIECYSVGIQATIVYWYRQFLKESFVLMATSNAGSDVTWEKDFSQDKFPISHPNYTFASLMVTGAHSEDSGLYFCVAEAQCWVEVRDLGKKACSSLPCPPSDPGALWEEPGQRKPQLLSVRPLGVLMCV
ncbi:T cell receptor beta chain, incomplete match [Sciurus carolinensis]|nr:T cell receptor beta chain, incomplete match [Sciurus carolinensis]